MSRIFISHATADNAKTRAIIEWIVSQGWPREEIFVDFDDIDGGQRWREALKKAASRCEAVVFLVSPTWRQRDWCGAEAFAVQMLYKKIIPVLIEPTPPEAYRDLLTVEYHLIDLTVPGPRCVIDVLMPDTGQTLPVALAESGLQRLVVGLKRAGLDPSTFPLTPGRKIYPGLAPLDTDDAAVLFGRDADIARGIETLRQMRERGQSLLAILAASGAGKSSFLRAGLWPRLQRADREFLILPVLRPGVDALNGEQGLVAGLHRAGETLGLKRNLADWRAQIESGDLAGALSVLHTAAHARMLAVDAAQPASASQTPPSQRHASLPPIPVLPIDQAEELFGAQGGEHARRLLDLLATALHEGRLIAVLAIRSDRYGDLQTAQALAGLEQRPFSLPPIADGVLKDVIEGPAQRDRKARGADGLNIDPQLTDRLLRDWADGENLPLLAFTLRRLLDDYGSDGRLNLEDYERSGQLQGALEAAIGRAMQDATAAGTLPGDAQEREDLIRRTFVPELVSFDPQNQQPHRRIAQRHDLPDESRDLIDRLIDARLLTCNRLQDNKASVEVAHEAILSNWPLLYSIIGQEREALIVLNDVKRGAEAWHASKKNDGALESEDTLLHRGEPLRHAERHLAHENFQRALGDEGRRYLVACRAKEAREIEDKRLQQEREAKQIARTKKIQLRFGLFLAGMVALIAVASVTLIRLQQATSQESANVLANLAAQAFDRHEYDRAVRLALAGVRKRDATLRAIDISAAENQLQHAGYRSILRAILAHEEEVVAASVSPDGRRVVTASGKTAQLWDAASGLQLAIMLHDDTVWSAVFSPNGEYILTASEDKFARLWKADSGLLVKKMPHHWSVNSASFSHDGLRIVTACGDNTVNIWDASSGRLLRKMDHGKGNPTEDINRQIRFDSLLLFRQGISSHFQDSPAKQKHPAFGVLSVTFSPNDTRIVTGSDDRTARLWDVASGSTLAIMKHKDAVWSASFSPNGKRIVTASRDETAGLWDGTSGQHLATMQHRGPVSRATFSPDSSRIVTASEDKIAHLWDAISGEPLATMQHDDHVMDAAFSPDGSSITTASADNTALLWDAKLGEQLATMQHDGPVGSAIFSPQGNRIITVSGGKIVRLWNTTSGRPFTTMQHDGSVVTTHISRDGVETIFASDDSLSRYAIVQADRLASSNKSIRESNRIVTSADDKSARVWPTPSAAEIIRTIKHSEYISSASFSPDGRRILTISMDKNARLWDARSGQLLARMPHDGEVLSAVFSPDGHRIVTTAGDNNVAHGPLRMWLDPSDSPADDSARLWDGTSGQKLATLQHRGPVLSATFSPDSRFIVTASEDKTARLWDSVSGRELV